MDFTAEDVLKIIRTCKKQGISEFSLGELKLSFGPKPVHEPVIPYNPSDPEREKELLADRELEIKQAMLDDLRLSDPYEYEQLICKDQEEEKIATQ